MAPCHVHLTVFVSISSQRVTDLLPAWYYNFRVSMVTWGDPPLSCCESSTVSFVTGNARTLRGRLGQDPANTLRLKNRINRLLNLFLLIYLVFI